MPEELARKIIQRIADHGPLPFRDFMDAALYNCEYGYYGSGRARIGRGGDFYTSVSVGPLFGRLLARQFAEMWKRLDHPDTFDIVEQGAHDGQFASDALDALKVQSPDCYACTRYTILGPSDVLRERQTAKLQRHLDRIRWQKSAAEGGPWTGVHFSNELVDAFPIHRVRWTGERWVERHVAWSGERFTFVDAEPSQSALEEVLKDFPGNVAPGFETEVNLDAKRWIREIAEKMERGWVLAIDYGHAALDFFHPDRANGTLAAYREHRRGDDPLADPGEQDLTAHVNFTALAEEGLRAGLHLNGFTDQHHFMVGLSRLHFRDEEEAITPEKQRELLAFKTLMHPGLLGISFRVLCLGRKTPAAPLSGFQMARDPFIALGLD